MLDIKSREQEILDFWETSSINEKVRSKNRNGKKFYFLDGPPYVTGDLHPGQMWVKVVKDITLRYRRYRGFNVRDRAGYDVHGLPIENKVEKQLGIMSKKEIETRIGIENFIRQCREYVDSFMGRMDRDYNRFGISLDFRNPYLAYRSEYIDTAWQMLKRIDERGFLYRGKKTTAFCTHCETALAQGSMEVTYADTDDPSIYVEFRVDRKGGAKIDIDDNTYLVIWTTTPWTLVSNVAVAVNPKELYVIARKGKKNLIVAKQRVDALFEMLNESLVVKSEFYGSELEGVKYINPLERNIPKQKELRRFHKVIFAEELVSMEEGTGLVHIAPGHGLDDYNLGIRNKLPIFSPIESNGRYNDDAGIYKGIQVPKDASGRIMEDLEAAGALIGKGTIRHSYPHCWRCDSKLIYMATEQWFFNIQKAKRKLIRENKRVTWHPEEAQKWLSDVIESSPDWCISRQRYWGIPMPIWVCKGCKSEVKIGSIEELRHMAQDKGQVESLKDLHRPYIDAIRLKCANCGAEMERIPDVLDVWYDASIAFRASMTREQFESMFPVDYILEGKDQLRGWFSYLLKTSVMAYGKAPYRNVGLDGMLLDEHGREMHKKLGNYVSLEEVHTTVGADTFRLWCSSHTPWLDLSWNKSVLKDAGKAVLILYNISNLISEYQGAASYAPKLKGRLNASKFDVEEAWMLSRLESTIDGVTRALEGYEAYKAAALVKGFITEDFSRFYLKMAKRSMLFGSKKKARQVMDVMNYVLFKTLIIASPIIPFATESVYRERYSGAESIFMEAWPKPNMKSVNESIERKMEVASETITAILNAREKAGIKLRLPSERATVGVNSDYAYDSINELSRIIEDYTNVRKLEVRRIQASKRQLKPVFQRLGPDFKENANAVARGISNGNADAIENDIMRQGHHDLHTENGTFRIRPEHFAVVETVEGSDEVAYKYGRVSISREISIELRNEGIVREFERNVQLIRKEMDLRKNDRIELGYEGVPEIAEIIAANSKEIKKYLNAAVFSAKALDGKRKDILIEETSMALYVRKAEA